MSKKIFKKKIFKKKIFFCENEKLNYFRFLGHFYYHGTLNVPCISESKSIRNWVTFCGLIIIYLLLLLTFLFSKYFLFKVFLFYLLFYQGFFFVSLPVLGFVFLSIVYLLLQTAQPKMPFIQAKYKIKPQRNNI